MKLTEFFRLRMPDGTDPVNIEDFNDNFEVIDRELKKRISDDGSASDVTVGFEVAESRQPLKSGEKLSVLMGKVHRFFTDLKTVAFSGKYGDLSERPSLGGASTLGVANNCTTTEAGFALDARQGKTLMDKSNELSRDLTRVNVYVGGDGKLHFVNSGGADSVLPFSPDASAKIDKFISDSKYIDFFDSKTQNVSVVDGAQYLICDIGQYSSKIKFNSGCIINKTYTIPGNKQPDRVPSEYIITANSSTISVSGSSGAFFIRLK